MAKFIEIDGRRIPLEDVEIVDVEPSDSRRRMDEFLKKLRGVLKLDDAASEEKILEAAGAALTKADSADERSLSDRAEAEGFELVKKDGEQVVVAQSDLDELKQGANDGREARKQLRQDRFDRAHDKAVSELRLSTSDEVKARYQKLYDADPDTTVELLDGLPRLANAKPRGSGKDDGTEEAPDGVDQDRHDLNERVEKRMADKGETYVVALDAVLKEAR